MRRSRACTRRSDKARAVREPVGAQTSAKAIATRLAAAGITLTSSECDLLAQFLDLLARWNRVYNLTGIRDRETMISRHLLESLALRFLLRGQHIADVGSGAGLPGVPLAIVERQRQFTLIESRAKRVRFLRHAAATLGLANVQVAHARIEAFDCGQPFDTVLARAVVAPAELAQITRHVTRPGSILLLLTAARLAAQPPGLPTDFVVRPIANEHALRAIRASQSSIALLERVPADAGGCSGG
jgi:16S rRNA (guanine527-N7)-methyltransferase